MAISRKGSKAASKEKSSRSASQTSSSVGRQAPVAASASAPAPAPAISDIAQVETKSPVRRSKKSTLPSAEVQPLINGLSDVREVSDIVNELIQTSGLNNKMIASVLREMAEIRKWTESFNYYQSPESKAVSRGNEIESAEQESVCAYKKEIERFIQEITILQRENAEITRKYNATIGALKSANDVISQQAEEIAKLSHAFLSVSEIDGHAEIAAEVAMTVPSIETQVELIKQDPRFDAKWYLRMYPDVEATGVDAGWHYVAHGSSENRDPGPSFSSYRYVLQNPDVRESGISALADAIIKGK